MLIRVLMLIIENLPYVCVFLGANPIIWFFCKQVMWLGLLLKLNIRNLLQSQQKSCGLKVSCKTCVCHYLMSSLYSVTTLVVLLLVPILCFMNAPNFLNLICTPFVKKLVLRSCLLSISLPLIN